MAENARDLLFLVYRDKKYQPYGELSPGRLPGCGDLPDNCDVPPLRFIRMCHLRIPYHSAMPADGLKEKGERKISVIV
jgi:hypothetical protein